MGLDWGFSLRNAKTNQDISLISFSGWNSKELMGALYGFGTKLSDKEEDDCEVSYDKDGRQRLFDFGKRLAKIEDILHGVSDRQIEYSVIPKKKQDQLYDLFYDLEIDYDDFIIFALRHLNTFLNFLQQGDLFDEWRKENAEWSLILWKSF